MADMHNVTNQINQINREKIFSCKTLATLFLITQLLLLRKTINPNEIIGKMICACACINEMFGVCCIIYRKMKYFPFFTLHLKIC